MPPSFPIVTLDTNVYVSGTTIPGCPPGQIMQAWEENRIKVALSEPILTEIQEVFSRPYFQTKLGWSSVKLDQYMNNLRFSAIVVPGATPVNVCKDPSDNILFSCALEANSDYIISGDKAVLDVKQFRNTFVVSPRDFVDKVLK
ncbi:putative toxin-antitoxin system toxin component, PIN family [Candidatus Woesebacteria bacterium]|nr:putative toxin-antitoxin system toxin component, PIN family [Candidatus Woesebacteria bacterium]